MQRLMPALVAIALSLIGLVVMSIVINVLLGPR
jgi:hypothetical protein